MTLGLLPLISISIFFKNSATKKTKIRSIKTFEQLPLYSTKATHNGFSGSKIVVRQTFNLDHRIYTLQKYIVCKFRVEIGHKFSKTTATANEKHLKVMHHFRKWVIKKHFPRAIVHLKTKICIKIVNFSDYFLSYVFMDSLISFKSSFSKLECESFSC